MLGSHNVSESSFGEIKFIAFRHAYKIETGINIV